jgi:hypothetical protein
MVLHRNIPMAAGTSLRPVYGFPEITGVYKNRHLLIVFEYDELPFTSVA